MRRFLGMTLFLAIAVPAAADDKDDAAKKLNGTYELVSFIREGKVDTEKKGPVTFTIKDGTITIKEGEKGHEETAKFTVDATKKPAQIDIKSEKGKMEVVMGIYEIKETDKGTELTLAFGHDNSPRPTDFKGEGKESAVIKLLKKKMP